MNLKTMMVQKKFKEFRTISEASGTNMVAVKKTAGHFVVCINGQEVEYFKTKPAADEAAKEATEALESDK